MGVAKLPSAAGTGARDMPWSQRLVEALPLPPYTVGLAFPLLHALTCVAWFAAFADPGLRPGDPLFWREILPPTAIMGSLAGFSIAGVAYSRRSQLRGLAQLRPALECSPERYEELVETVQSFDSRALRRWGLGLALLLPPLITFNPSAFPWRLGPELEHHGAVVTLWSLWSNGVVIWFGTRAAVFEQRAARLFSEIGRSLARVDLLDPEPLAPFGRRGLHSALMYVVGLSLFSLIFAGGWAVNVAPLGMLALILTAGGALLLPLRGVHERIVAAKHGRLAELRREIVREERLLLDREAPDGARAAARLPALLALHDRVEAAREWPLDVSGWSRFGLYLAIGLGSWVGAALVERMLDVALD